jgi:hypothetical protein
MVSSSNSLRAPKPMTSPLWLRIGEPGVDDLLRFEPAPQ